MDAEAGSEQTGLEIFLSRAMSVTNQILLISPNDTLIDRLGNQLSQEGLSQELLLLSDYPKPAAITNMLRAGPGTVSLAVIDLAKPPLALRLIRRLKAADPSVLVVAVDSYHRLSSIVAAKQSGAWAYLTPPYDLRQLVDHLQGAKATGGRNTGTGIVSFIPAQGGNGASTVSLHVANTISQKLNGQTLLSDFDFHCGTIAFQLRLEPKRTLADALRQTELSSGGWQGFVSRWNYIDALVAPVSNAGLGPEELAGIPSLLAAARKAYRYVVADLPPAVFSSSVEIMKLSDLVCLVCTPEITSLHLARRKVAQIRKQGVPVERLRLLVNRVGAWGAVETERVSTLVGVPVTWALDNDYPAVSKAAWEGGLIADRSSLAKQFQELGSQIIASTGSDEEPCRRGIADKPSLATQLHSLAAFVGKGAGQPVSGEPMRVKRPVFTR